MAPIFVIILGYGAEIETGVREPGEVLPCSFFLQPGAKSAIYSLKFSYSLVASTVGPSAYKTLSSDSAIGHALGQLRLMLPGETVTLC